MNISALKDAMKAAGLKAQETVDAKDLTFAEKREALDKIDAEVKSYADQLAVHEQAARLISGGESAPEVKSESGVQMKGIADQVLESKAYAATVAAKAAGARFSHSAEIKAAGVPINEGSAVSGYGMNGEAGALVTPEFLPGIQALRFQQLLIADLFASGSTASSIVSYVVESAWNDNAAATAEGGNYVLSDDTVSRISDQVGKVTNALKMTDEMLQDAEQFRSFVEGRLTWSVKRKEEAQLLNGTGYPGVQGLLQRSGMLAPASIGVAGTNTDPVDVIDSVYNQITALRTESFVEPDAIVVNAGDWQNIRLAKDANKQYYAGGPFTGAYGNGGYSNVDALWGLPVVITSAVAAGSMLIGSFRENGQVFRRQGLTVEMTNSNEADFLNGLIAVRATERLALAVYRPQAFGLVNVIWK